MKFLEVLFGKTFPFGGREGCVLQINKVNSDTGYQVQLHVARKDISGYRDT